MILSTADPRKNVALLQPFFGGEIQPKEQNHRGISDHASVPQQLTVLLMLLLMLMLLLLLVVVLVFRALTAGGGRKLLQRDEQADSTTNRFLSCQPDLIC